MALQQDWDKNGPNGFSYELLEECQPGKCEVLEAEYMDKFDSLNPLTGYNVKTVASKGYSGKKRGRPALGNVLFAKRVSPAMAEVLRSIAEGGPRTLEVPSGPVEKKVLIEDDKLRKDLENMTKAYTDAYNKCEELSLQLVAANRDMEDCLAMAEEEKTKYWRNRCLTVEAAIKAKSNEFNQE